MPLASRPPPALQQRHSLGSCRPRTPAAPRRSSVASTAAGSCASPSSSPSPRSPSSSLDLATLRVSVAEMRLTPDGTWLYALRVSTAAARGALVLRRYSELRAFWDALRAAMATHGAACEEHCHFLAGMEADKFPKKRLLHTKHVLEARANALDDFLLRLSMRLNLCSAPAANACRARACPVLALLDEFLRPAPPDKDESERTASTAASPASSPTTSRPAPLTKYRSFPLLRADADNRFLTQSGRRLSFAATGRGVLRSM